MTTVRLAETAFRWLMRAYPARFRRTHGLALFELFRDDVRAAQHERGAPGVVAVLARATLDTLANAPRLWREQGRMGGKGRMGKLSSRFAGSATGALHDVRIAARHLRRAPGFTAVSVAMLAIGIGANTTIFSLMNAVLLRPLSAYEPDRVVRVVARSVTAGAAARRFSVRDFADYRERTTTLEDVSGVNLATFLLAADNRTDQILGEIASGRYLSVLGARAAQGRLLTDADDSAAAPPVAVISDTLWRHRFGGQPVVGKPIFLSRTNYTIVGVADPSLLGSFIAAPVDVWVPIGSSGSALGARWDADRSQRTLALVGRLRPGVTRDQAQRETQTIAEALAREFAPELHPVVDVLPGTLVTGEQRRMTAMFLSLLLGLVALVLVIACANVGNLLLARVLGRRRELAIRVALGASRGRLARMLAIESVLIAAAGGAAAFVLSAWTSRIFDNLSPLPTLTLRLGLRPDARVLAFTVLASLAAAAILALVGAVQAMRPDIAPALKEDATASIGGRRPARLRGALAMVQITVSLLLVTGAALFARSVRAAGAIDLGFDPRGVVVMDVDAANGRTSAESVPVFRDVLRRVEAIAGVEAAAVSTRAPLDTSTPLVRVNPREPIAAAADISSPTVSFLVVSPRYFDVVKTPLAAGRVFTDRDDADHAPVVMVNETLASRLWPGGDAIGRRLWLERHAAAAPCVVVGIANDSKYVTLGEGAQGHVYLPFLQQPRRGMALLVRSAGPADRVAAAMQDALHAVDPSVQGFFTRTLEEHVAVSTLPVRLAANVTTGVAVLALALACVGLYSLVSFLVAERTAEIGLRMALGASRSDVLRLVAGHGVRLAAVGLAIGIPLALASTRLLRGLLYGVSATDPIVFAAASALVLAFALAACVVPARRAMRLDPLAALRRE